MTTHKLIEECAQNPSPRQAGRRVGARVLRRMTGLALVSVTLMGCSLPGWQLEPDSGSVWYGEIAPKYAGDEADYDPIILEITPTLIRRMQEERAEEQTDPGAVSRAPRTADGPDAYRVGEGDVLGIIVYGHPELTNPTGTDRSFASTGYLVDSDGEIYFPFIGEIEVAGDTLDEIRREITEGLNRVIRDPQVNVNVLKFRSKKVVITGDISQPCSVPITTTRLTIAEALGACRSLLSEGKRVISGVNSVKLVRDGEVYALNLSELYLEGGEPIALQDGDRLVLDDSVNRIFLVGEFENQTAAPYSAGGMTLWDAIIAAGGINVKTADPSEIYVIRGFVAESSGPLSGLETKPRPVVYHWDASSFGALILANQFKLQPRDVIYAAPASMVSFNRALAQIAPSLNILLRSALIYDRAADN